jgi:hypothetical protein
MMERPFWGCWACLPLLISLVAHKRLEKNPVTMQMAFSEQASRAISEGKVRPFLDQHRRDGSFWDWMNSDQIDMRSFLAVGKELSVPERERGLKASRQLILQYYEIAARPHKAEPRSPTLTELDQIRAEVGVHPERSAESTAAVSAVLEQSNPEMLLDDSHKALLYYSFLSAAHIPSLSNTVRRLVADHLAFFSEEALLSMAAVAYGPSFIRLICDACLSQRRPDESEACGTLIERGTGLRPSHREDNAEFSKRALAWYEANKSRLIVDKGALYPAPPFRPLFKVKGEP